MEIKKLWEVILRRKWIIIQAFIIIFSVILIGALLQTPTYQASCHVVIEQQGTQEALLRSIGMEQVSEILFAMNLGQKSSLVAVEMMKILTKPILDLVVKRMELKDEKGDFIPGNNIKMTTPVFSWYPSWGVEVKPHKQANIMTVLGYSANPQEALDFCNLLTQIYIESDIEKKHKETADAARFAEEQSIKAKADWSEAKRKYKEFQESEGLVDFTAEAQILINQIAGLKADQNILELSIGDSRLSSLQDNDPYMIGGQNLSSAGQVGQLKSSISQLEAQLHSNLTKFTENHPGVIALKEEIRELESKLLKEKEIFENSGTSRYQSLQEQIDRLYRRLNGFPEKLYTLAQLSLQADTFQSMYTMLLDMKYRLNITKAMQISKLSVIEPAWKASIYKPNIGTNLTLALVLGLMVGFGLAFLIEYLDDTIKDGDTIQNLFDVPMLGTVPLMSNRENRYLNAEEVESSRRQLHLLNEAFNIISYNIKLGSIDEPLKHVMITSSTPSEGKTSVSSNLGINIARKGKKVLIVDSDFPRPNINKVFELPNDKGLTNIILGENTIEEVLQDTNVETLKIITTGPKPPSSTLLFESKNMKDFVSEAESKFDFIIFDTPPVLTLNDPVILGSLTDRTILVVGANEVPRQMIKQGLQTLRKGRNKVLGVVLNKVKTEGSHYYYYYYYYHSDDSGNGFKKMWYNSLALFGMKKKRRHRSQDKVMVEK